MKIEIPDEIINGLRKKRAETLYYLFESDKTLLPEIVFKAVLEVRTYTEILNLIDKEEKKNEERKENKYNKWK